MPDWLLMADHVRVVGAPYIHRIDGEVGDGPLGQMFLLSPVHALGDGVLVGAEKAVNTRSPA